MKRKLPRRAPLNLTPLQVRANRRRHPRKRSPASQNLQYKDLNLTYDGASGAVTVTGIAPDQATKEKILLCCCNVQGVGSVIDEITVEKPEPESNYYTVVSGDTLSKISKAEYGDPNKYMKIFEANKPMLKDPDKIYPRQSLRIPQL